MAVALVAIGLFVGHDALAASSPTALVNKVQLLSQQNRDLAGQVESLKHRLDQLEQANKEQYLLLDHRLNELEGTSKASSSKAGEDKGKDSTSAGKVATTADANSSGGKEQAENDIDIPDNPEDAYKQAFDTLQAGHYSKAVDRFAAFTRKYPDDKLTPNAWYWLGEAHYTTRAYDKALKDFQYVLDHFPDSNKAAGALLKKGYSQYAMGNDQGAVKTLKQVINKYPDSSSAKLAVKRIDDIQESASQSK